MNETDVPGHQGDASVAVGSRSSVLEISLDAESVSRELASDLMVPAGEQIHFHEEISVSLSYGPVTQLGEPGSGMS